MSCARFDRDLVGFVYDELAAADRRRVEEHLKACEACRDTVARLRATVGALGTAGERGRVDVGLVYRSAAQRLERSRRAWRLGACVASLLALLAGGFLLARAELSVSSERLVVSWRERSAVTEPPAVADDLCERIGELEELLRLVALEVESANRTGQQNMERLEQAIAALEARNERRVRALGRDVYAMYLDRATSNDG